MRWILSLILSACILSSCTQPAYPTQSNSSEEKIDLSKEIPALPSIQKFYDSSALSTQDINSLAQIYGCSPNSTGPYFKLQTETMQRSTYNYLQFDAKLPNPQVIVSDGVQWNEFIYGGAAVSSNGKVAGDFDAMVATGTGTPLGWRPSLSARVSTGNNASGYSATFNKSISGEDYSGTRVLDPNQTVTLKIWITKDSSGKAIAVLGVTGKYAGSLHTLYQSVQVDPIWLVEPSFAFKSMATIAQLGETSEGYARFSSTSEHSKFSGWAISNLKYGLVDSKGKPTTPIKSLSAGACVAPTEGMVSYSSVSDYSGTIGLRLSGIKNVKRNEVITNGDRNHPISGSVLLQNIGIPISKIDFSSIKLDGVSKPDITIFGGKSNTINYSINCEDKTYTKTFTLEFIYRDYSTSTVTGDTLGNFAGGYLKQKSVEPFTANCKKLSYQNFNMAPPGIKALINTTGQFSTSLVISTSDNTPLTSGQFSFAPTPSAGIAGISAQGITANPSFTPSNGSFTPPAGAASITIPVVVSATCGGAPTPPTTVSAVVTDPTNNTTSYTFPVTLTCIGPKISDPTPNPLTLSGNVGDTVSGSFSFSNVGEATPDGQRASLTYSVSGSDGLNVAGNTAGRLAGGETATVNVSAKCETPGQKSYTVTVMSDDPDQYRANYTESVSISCKMELDVIAVVRPYTWQVGEIPLDGGEFSADVTYVTEIWARKTLSSPKFVGSEAEWGASNSFINNSYNIYLIDSAHRTVSGTYVVGSPDSLEISNSPDFLKKQGEYASSILDSAYQNWKGKTSYQITTRNPFYKTVLQRGTSFSLTYLYTQLILP